MGEYADLFSAPDDKPAAGMALRFGIETPPDQAAEAAQLARRYRIPAGVALEFREDYKRRAQVEDAQAVVERSPKLRSWLAEDFNRSNIAHDDIQTLGAIETSLRVLKNIPLAVASEGPGVGASLYGMGAAAFELPGGIFRGAEDWLAERMGAPRGMGTNAGETIGRALLERARSARNIEAHVFSTPPDAGTVERGIYSGIKSVARQVLAVSTGNPAIATGSLVATCAGPVYVCRRSGQS
jgi:hypothetical protein